MTFPQTGQLANEFFIDPRDLFAGDRYAPDFNNDEAPTAVIGSRAEIGQVDTITVTWVADDQFGFVYDGVIIAATGDTDDDTSAAALEVAVQAAIDGALAGQITEVSVATNVVTVTSVAGTGAHALVDYEPDTTLVLIANSTPASGVANVLFGMGVTQDASFPDLIGPGHSAVRDPLTSADAFYGVMVRQMANNYDAAQLQLLGLSTNALPPLPAAFQAVRRGRITVPWVGTLPTGKGNQPVFWINDATAPATDRGFFRNDAGGVAVEVLSTEVEGIITRPSADGVFTGFVKVNFR